MRSMFVFVLILLFGVGCGVGDGGGTAMIERDASALSAPVPGPTCTDGVTQFAAAQQIAAAACEALGEDGNAMCMAPIVARYCPDPSKCGEVLCGPLLDKLSECVAAATTDSQCDSLFPNERLTHVVIPPSAARPRMPSTEFHGHSWSLTPLTHEVLFPLTVPVGCSIAKWGVLTTKGWGSSILTAGLQRAINWWLTDIGPAVSTQGQAGIIHMAARPPDMIVEDLASYSIRVTRDTTVNSSDTIWYAEVWYRC